MVDEVIDPDSSDGSVGRRRDSSTVASRAEGLSVCRVLIVGGE